MQAIDRTYFFNEGLRFECQRCGQCCTGEPGTIYVGPQEIAPMAEYLGLPENRLIETYFYPYKDSYSIREDDRGNCLFYNQGCGIYPVRPFQCISFPFWFSNLRSQARWRTLAKECPGVDQGRLYSKEQILEQVQQAMKF